MRALVGVFAQPFPHPPTPHAPAEDEDGLRYAIEPEEEVERVLAPPARLQPHVRTEDAPGCIGPERREHRDFHPALAARLPHNCERVHGAVQCERRVGDRRAVAVGGAGDVAEANRVDSERVECGASRHWIP